MSSTALLVVCSVLFGIPIASFCCVVIDRLPVRLDEPDEFGSEWGIRGWVEVLGGRSRCSQCGRPVSPIDNVPLVSWIVLRGRCRGCGGAYGAFHPVVEVVVPTVAALLASRLGATWRVAPALWLAPVGVTLAVIDWRTRLLPTRIIWPAFGVSVALTTLAAAFEGRSVVLVAGVVGAAALAAPIAAVWWFVPQGMGFGDVRLAVLLGWTVGVALWPYGLWAAAFAAIVAMTGAALVGAVVGLVVVGRRATIAFGPPLIAAAFLVMVFADTLGGRF